MRADYQKLIPLWIKLKEIYKNQRLPLLILVFFSLFVLKLNYIGKTISHSTAQSNTGEVPHKPLPPQSKIAPPSDPISASPAESKVKESPRDTNLPMGVLNLTFDEMEILQNIAERRQQLKQLEEERKKEETLLTVAKKNVEEKIEELSKIKQDLKGFIDSQKQEKKERLAALARMYSTMRPKRAAALMAELDTQQIIDLIFQMKEATASSIFSHMPSDKVREVTIQLTKNKEPHKASLGSP